MARQPVCSHKKPGSLLLNRKPPVLVASVVDEAGLRRVLHARRRPWDVVELRVDLLGHGHRVYQVATQLAEKGVPVVATVRLAKEGGKWRGDERERADVYQRLLPHISAVDIELQSSLFESLAKETRAHGVAVIGSFHDFTGTPSRTFLEALARRGWARGADIVKIATVVRTDRDVQKLKGLLRTFRGRRLCVIGMSDVMRNLRVDLARAGSFLAYGHVGFRAAPGQMACAALRRRIMEGGSMEGVRHGAAST